MKRIDSFLNHDEIIEKELGPDFIKTFLTSKPVIFSIILLIFIILVHTTAYKLSFIFFLIPFALILIGLIPTYIKCTFTKYYITNQKIIIEQGIIGRDYDIVKLDRVLDVNLDVSVLDTIFRTGCIKLCTANETEPVQLFDVRNPKEVIQRIQM